MAAQKTTLLTTQKTGVGGDPSTVTHTILDQLRPNLIATNQFQGVEVDAEFLSRYPLRASEMSSTL
jgi:hypothetical protein